jgi:enterochelin esterase-like enzyme
MLVGMRILLVLACAACSGESTPPSATASLPPADPLDRAKPVERELRTGEKHRFRIELPANHVAIGVVDQRGVDVQVVTFDSAGKQLRAFDSPNGERGPEPFVVEAKSGGAYFVEVAPFELPPGAPPQPIASTNGKYEVKLDDVISGALYAERLAALVIDSPRVLELWRAARDHRTAELDKAWRELKGKSPLVEPYPNDPKDVLVTWIYRAKTPYVGLIGGPNLKEKPMLRILDSDVWYLTARVPAGATMIYAFIATDGPPPFRTPWQKERAPDTRWAQKVLDPNNAATAFDSSTVTLPGAAPQPWIAKKPEVAAGTLTELKLDSAQLKETRNLAVYTPAGYDPKQTYPLVIAFDGEPYGLGAQALIPLPTILDNLIAAHKIPPLVAVLVANQGTRGKDLAQSAPFAAFVAQELVPKLRADYRAGMTPADTIVTGSSLGGLCSTFVAFRHSDVIGKVLSNSGSYWFTPGAFETDISTLTEGATLIRELAAAPKLPIVFYLDAGIFEDELLQSNRRLRDVLVAKGYPVTYAEFPGGHDYNMWRGTIADGLIALTAK